MFECVTVELDLKKHKNITVSCVYRTPGSDVDLFCESLEQIFSDVMPRKSMFICGDFNIDLMKHETHNGTKRFLDCMYGLGLYPLIDRPSRRSQDFFLGGATRYIFVTSPGADRIQWGGGSSRNCWCIFGPPTDHPPFMDTRGKFRDTSHVCLHIQTT